jgi:hypothetical protein
MPRDELELRRLEREIWHGLYGDSAECKEARTEARRQFNTLFPFGHRTTIRNIIEEQAGKAATEQGFEYLFRYLSDVHPRAWEIILKHGKDYRPISWRRSTPQNLDDNLQPIAGVCYRNAIKFIYNVRALDPKTRAVYVEGFAMGPLVYPMLHAWNGKGFSGTAADFSFYAVTMLTRYFGIPFTLEEYKHIVGVPPDSDEITTSLLFHRKKFERFEEQILEVLKKPRTRLVLPKG